MYCTHLHLKKNQYEKTTSTIIQNFTKVMTIKAQKNFVNGNTTLSLKFNRTILRHAIRRYRIILLALCPLTIENYGKYVLVWINPRSSVRHDIIISNHGETTHETRIITEILDKNYKFTILVSTQPIFLLSNTADPRHRTSTHSYWNSLLRYTWYKHPKNSLIRFSLMNSFFRRVSRTQSFHLSPTFAVNCRMKGDYEN